MMPARTASARAEPRRMSRGAHAARRKPRRGKPSTARRPSKASGRAKAPKQRLRVAGPPRRRRLPYLITSFFVVGIVVMGVAGLQAVVSQGSFRMQQLARHNLELQHEYGRLKLQVAELSSPARIAREARRLGYRLPSPDDLRTLSVKGPDQPTAGPTTLGRPVLSLKKQLGQGP